jgi:hypothetical protein
VLHPKLTILAQHPPDIVPLPDMLNSQSMLGMEDQRWNTLLGRRRTRYDPRPALAKLQSGTTDGIVWDEFHQKGDGGEASYAFAPHLGRICRERPTADWSVDAIIAISELAPKRGNNPDVPT